MAKLTKEQINRVKGSNPRKLPIFQLHVDRAVRSRKHNEEMTKQIVKGKGIREAHQIAIKKVGK